MQSFFNSSSCYCADDINIYNVVLYLKNVFQQFNFHLIGRSIIYISDKPFFSSSSIKGGGGGGGL